MRAVIVTTNGGPDVLELAEIDSPELGDDQVLVDVAAAGVNYIDTYQRSGNYSIPTPFTLGLEGAGIVRSVGAAVGDVGVGDRVAWNGVLGSYAEQVAVPASAAVPVPSGVSDELAAALMLQGVDGALPGHLHLSGPARRLGGRACGGRRGRAAADPDRQAAGREGPGYVLDPG